jgi:hypothetical protein
MVTESPPYRKSFAEAPSKTVKNNATERLINKGRTACAGGIRAML